MKKILVLCLGNICRSPMAEALLRVHLPNAVIQSAGIRALVGEAPAPFAQEVMLAHTGVDISHHRAQQMTQAALLDADLILVMDRKQQQDLHQAFPIIKGKVLRLGEWSGYDIPDPYRRPKLVFEQTFLLIQKCCIDWAENLK